MMREVERLSITVVADNYYDALRPDAGPAARYRTSPGASIRAEHGLSYFVQTTGEGATHSFMFDYGVDGEDVLNNMSLLDVKAGAVDALALSHGHFDHWGGLPALLAQNRSAMKKDMPLYVGEEAFAQRYSRRASGDLADIGRLDRAEIEEAWNIRIVEVGKPVEMLPGVYLSGPIERTTGYEHPQSYLLLERDGELVQDRFPGEQALFFDVKDKGLVVLSGCAHAGIVNTVRHVQKVAGMSRLHALLGGFHLINAHEDVIEATVADIKAMAPDYLVPTHCTGFEATVRFREEMAERFILNTAGTRYFFEDSSRTIFSR